MENLVYETVNFGDAQAFARKNLNGVRYRIDCYTSGSRTDANGVLLTQKTYQVFQILD